jgi:hypothetical protein
MGVHFFPLIRRLVFPPPPLEILDLRNAPITRRLWYGQATFVN